MENDTFARKLEKDFSLPWHLQRVGEASEIITASGNPLFYIKCGKTEQDWNACKYLVHCANLMPAATRLLNEALRIIEKACIACANIDAYHCGLCGRIETTREIKALLAKLEGGAETE